MFKKGKKVEKVELHGFSDASKKAHGCVVYLRTVYKTGEIKSKVNPITKQSISRLELLCACLLTNFVNTVRNISQEELKEKNVELYYWVESMATLCWKKTPNRGRSMCVTECLKFGSCPIENIGSFAMGR